MKLREGVVPVLLLCALCSSGGASDVSSFFSWEAIFGESIIDNDFSRNPQIISVENFVNYFGKTLDHCNDKLEEAAVVSKQVVRNFVDKLFNKGNFSNDDSLSNISLDNVDFQATISRLPKPENVILPERADNALMWEYLQDILDILHDACDDLPLEIQSVNLDTELAPREDLSGVLEQILEVMTQWAMKWSVHMQEAANIFIESCIKEQVCENNLQIIIEIVRDALENDENFPDELSDNQTQYALGSTMFWEAMSARENVTSTSVNDINSFLRLKLRRMTGILSRFAAPPPSTDTSSPSSSSSSSFPSSPAANGTRQDAKDGERLRRLAAAALNVVRYPWRVEDANAAVAVVGGRVASVSPAFLSVAAGSWRVAASADLASPVLRRLLEPLSPALLRVGGTSANLMTYETGTSSPASSPIDGAETFDAGFGARQFAAGHPKLQRVRRAAGHPKLRDAAGRTTKGGMTNFTLTQSQLQTLLGLCGDLHWTLLFDLNQLLRTPDGAWNTTQARQIIKDTKNSSCNVIWQLGNEPNSYHHHGYPLNMTGELMAEDYTTLRKVLLEEETFFRRIMRKLKLSDGEVKIIGPDVTEPKVNEELREDSLQFLEQFLAAPGVVDAVSWHQYSLSGATATAQQLMSPRRMEELRAQARRVAAVRDRSAPGTPTWLTETGSASGGGAPGLSCAFAASFGWLDKLGVAAQEGVAVVARQALLGGSYALFDRDLTPRPDYWVSVLHKRLVGEVVLRVTMEGAPDTLRLYAHCRRGVPGRAVLFGLNVGEEVVPFGLQLMVDSSGGGDVTASAHVTPHADGKEQRIGAPTEPFLEYILTPTRGDVRDRSVALNGVPLATSADGSLPALEPRAASTLLLPPRAIGFWEVAQADVAACR